MENFKSERPREEESDEAKHKNNLNRRNFIVGATAAGGGVLAAKAGGELINVLETHGKVQEVYEKYLIQEIDRDSFDEISSAYTSVIKETYQQFSKHDTSEKDVPEVVAVMEKNTDHLDLEEIIALVRNSSSSGAAYFADKVDEAKQSGVDRPYAILGVLEVFLRKVTSVGKEISHDRMSMKPNDMRRVNVLPSNDREPFNAVLESVSHFQEKLLSIFNALKEDAQQEVSEKEQLS